MTAHLLKLGKLQEMNLTNICFHLHLPSTIENVRLSYKNVKIDKEYKKLVVARELIFVARSKKSIQYLRD